MKIEFNSTKRADRYTAQRDFCIAKIAEAWGDGIPGVDLSVDTDLFEGVRQGILTLVDDAGLAIVAPKQGLSKRKGNKTLFRIIHKEIS